tara:strand:+ start:85 stop:309 length:225 start_codon:yes stop_codon:yes gene_type:complete
MALEVMTSAKFSHTIEEIAYSKKIPYMDAIVWYCDKNEVEIEVAAKLINAVLKSKIEAEAQDLNFLPKVAKLPL